MTPARRVMNKIHLPSFAKLFDEKSRVLFIGIHWEYNDLYKSWFKGVFETLDILPEVRGIKPDIQADITNCPQVSDNTYDGVVCIGIYEYEIDQKKMVLEINRVLKPDGKALVCVPGPAYYHNRPTILPEHIIDYLKPLKLLSLHITYYKNNPRPYYIHTVSQK